MGVLVMQGGSDWWVFKQRKNGAILERIENAAQLTPEQLAKSIADCLIKLSITRPRVILGLASETCLPAAMMLEHPSGSRDRTVLTYALEESLPLAAEEMEADFQFSGSSGLGVAVHTVGLAPLVRELEQRGIVVQSITATALLAAQRYTQEVARKGATLVLWQEAERVEMVLVERSVPRKWISIPAEPSSLIRELQFAILGLGQSVEVVSQTLAEELVTAAESVLPVCQCVEPSPLREAAALAAADVLSGRLTPWFEFRRGKLGPDDPRRPIRGVLRFVAFTAATFLVCVSIALLVRAGRFREHTISLQEEQVKIYQQAFPNERLPAGIRSRLESEVAKLAGSTGQGEQLPAVIPTLRLLRDFLLALPKEMRYRVVDLRIEHSRLSLEIEVRSHSDADVIASALRARGFVVDQPRSEQLPQQGVAVRLSATAKQAEKSTQGA